MSIRKGTGKGSRSTQSSKSARTAHRSHVPSPQDVLEHLHEGVCFIDRRGLITYVNPRMAEMLGYSGQEMVGRHLFDFINEKDRAAALEYEKKRKAGRSERHDFELLTKNGEHIFTSVESSPIFDKTGNYQGILAAVQDISWRKEVEDRLKQSDERYRTLFHNPLECIYILNLEGDFLEINSGMQNLLYYSRDELLSMTFFDLLVEEQKKKAVDISSELHAQGWSDRARNQWTLIRKDGGFVTIDATGSLLYQNNKPYAILGIARDITAERQTAEALKETYLQYQNIIEFLPDATFVIDTRGVVIAWNRAIEEMTGIAKSDILGKGNYEYSLPFYGERRKIVIDYVLENAPDAVLNYLNIKWEGNILYANAFATRLRQGRGAYCFVKASRLYNSRGELTGAIEAVRDITEMMLAEQALKESEKRYRDIFENSLDGMFQSSAEGKFLSVNKALAQMYGVSNPEELLREISDIPLQLYASPEKRRDLVHIIQKDGTVNNFETEFITRDGKKFWVSITARAVKDEQGKIIRYEGSVRDINRRKTAEDELNRLQVMYKATLESTGDGIIVTDQAGNVLLTNRRFQDMWRLPDEVVRATHIDDIFRHAGQELEDQHTFIDNLHKLNTSIEADTSTVKFKDGRIFERFSTPLTINGEVAGRVSSYRDVTEIRHMENELNRTQKLDSLGILAGGIAHDFNNILTGILGNITMARMEAQPDSSIYTVLEEAEKAAVRAKDLTQQLLTFARGGAPIRKTASIQDILYDTVNFALRGSKSSCKFNIPDDLWHAEIDRGQISQVINNMVINSDEAMPQGGNINISAENVMLRGETTFLAPGRYIKISITDGGTGIPDEHLNHIFDPYFTTKQKGSGLGLATSYSIIKKHGGTITVSSQLGSGSTFNIFIPASEKKMEQTAIQPKQQNKRQGRILLMDDEAMVLEVAARMLRHIGYSDIQTTTSGEEAIEAYRRAMSEGNPFSLVIMDLTVPGGMGGETAIKYLLEIDPSARVIVSSGYFSGPVLSDYRKFGFSAIIGKPYTVDELERALEEALNL